MKKRTAALIAVILLWLPCWTFADYATIQNTDKGAQVVLLQQALNALGYDAGSADGSFGSRTENAVRAFQRDHGLKVDGKAGNVTQTLLYKLADAQSAPQQTAPTAVPVQTVAPTSSNPTTAGLFNGDYSTLRYGMIGARVGILQKTLKQLGYYAGSLDQHYGTGTKSAVESFQRTNNLTVDGAAGSKTLKALEKAAGSQTLVTAAPTPAPTAAPVATVAPTESSASIVIPTRTLRKGYTGSDVLSLQNRLKVLGHYSGKLDGSYGTGTVNAVKAFQTANKLTADGIAGSKTCALLFKDVQQPVTATAVPTQAPVNNTPAPTSNETLIPTRTLRKGYTGADVKSVQQRLTELKYYMGSIDSSYGTGTIAAVQAFQKANGLTADGIAGPKTFTILFSDQAKPAENPSSNATTVSVSAPSKSQIKLLHWFNDIKPSIRTGQTVLVYEPSSGISWTLRLYSLGRHADSEPLTLADTQNMLKAFGGVNTWNQKAVYVRLPNGQWTVGSTHDMPHLSGSISNNGFNGHLCLHFLRDMDECSKNDPSYGVANQQTIRAAWKALTGETVK